MSGADGAVRSRFTSAVREMVNGRSSGAPIFAGSTSNGRARSAGTGLKGRAVTAALIVLVSPPSERASASAPRRTRLRASPRRGCPHTPGSTSLSRAFGEVQQRRDHAAADDALLGEVELREDPVHVLLHAPLRQKQRLGNGGIRFTLRHLGEHVQFTGGERTELGVGRE